MSEVKVLATIAGEPFTETDLERYIETLPAQQKTYAANPMFREQILQQVINTRLMAKLGEDEKLDETELFQQTLKSIRSDILAQSAIQMVVDAVTVTKEEVEEYFNAHKDSFAKSAIVGAKHILVDTEEECKDIYAKINNGELSFEDAAAQFSTCPSKERGGDLGEFGHGQMVAEFDQAAFAADVDTVTEPVKTQFGYHLIKVYSKYEAEVPAFDEVAASVEERVLNERRNEAIQNTLSQLRERYLQA